MKSTSAVIFPGLLVIFVNAFVNGQNSSDSLQCYICESKNTGACQEAADISVLTSAACNDLSYSKSGLNHTEVINDIISKSVDGKIHGTPLLDSIFQKNGQRSAADEVKYVCLTVAFSSGDMKGTTRTCERVPSHVKDACDFIKQDVPELMKIRKCTACTKNYCNSAPAEVLTFFLIFVVMSTIMLTK